MHRKKFLHLSFCQSFATNELNLNENMRIRNWMNVFLSFRTEAQSHPIPLLSANIQLLMEEERYRNSSNKDSNNSKRNVTKLKNTPAITFSKTRASITTVGKYHLNISSRQNYPSHLHLKKEKVTELSGSNRSEIFLRTRKKKKERNEENKKEIYFRSLLIPRHWTKNSLQVELQLNEKKSSLLL